MSFWIFELVQALLNLNLDLLNTKLLLQAIINGDAIDNKEETLLEQELETDNTLLSVFHHDTHQQRWASYRYFAPVTPTGSIKYLYQAGCKHLRVWEALGGTWLSTGVWKVIGSTPVKRTWKQCFPSSLCHWLMNITSWLLYYWQIKTQQSKGLSLM